MCMTSPYLENDHGLAKITIVRLKNAINDSIRFVTYRNSGGICPGRSYTTKSTYTLDGNFESIISRMPGLLRSHFPAEIVGFEFDSNRFEVGGHLVYGPSMYSS